MTREEAIKLLVNATYSDEWQGNEDLTAAHNMAIEALEMVEEFEKAQIITGGRLNGRTYAYKCGLEDGKRKALEQETSKDAVSRKAMLDAITEIDENINMDIYTNEVREIIRELPPVTSTQRWIPVGEELPKEHIYDDGFVDPSEPVLVQLNNKDMKVSRYWGSREKYKDEPWIDLSYPTTLEVVAWMPLPQPYKAESEG